MKYLLNQVSIVLIAILLLGLFAFPASAIAAHYQSGQDVMLPAGETVNTDYFAAGRNVTINGTVNGDVYTAGGNILINGTINGDVLAAGGNLSISGKVSGNIRAAGGEIVISSTVGSNVSVAGGSINLQNPAHVSGSMAAAGGNISLLAPVNKDVTIAGGQANIGDTIGGNVSGGVGQLSILPKSDIAGDLTYWSNNKANISSGSRIAGQTTYHYANWKAPNPQEQQKKAAGGFAGFSILWAIMSLITTFIIGILFLKFVPVYTQTTVDTILSRPWLSLGMGFLVTIVFPAAFVILLITIIGIPVALILLVVFIIFAYLSKILIAVAIGQKLLKKKTVWVFLLGLVIYDVVTWIPVLGWAVGLFGFFIGFGAMMISKKHFYGLLRGKKMI